MTNTTEHTFTLTNDQIRELVPFQLTDEDCKGIVSMLGDNFKQFVRCWATEYRVDHPHIANPCEVIAVFNRQVWQNDYAVSVGEVEFECQDALDQYKLSDLPPYSDWLHDRGWLNCGDELFFTSVSLGLVPDWDGPFDLYVNDEMYEYYMDDRVLREYGYEPRKEDEDE